MSGGINMFPEPEGLEARAVGLADALTKHAIQVEDNVQPLRADCRLYGSHISWHDLSAALQFYLRKAEQQRNEDT